MTPKDILDHETIAKKLSWDQLASVIIDLEVERHEMIQFLKPNEYNKYDALIQIYEQEKHERIQAISKPYRFYLTNDDSFSNN